ncbi:hypothetical protein SERLA73DRAFT_66109 [Serpula lacrymans var. lacrymans S7.3]|uniref:Uncharacterized protein n=1 Tax=Serpula lacrymans var. lacrymans (strain S7.3) TaxID=936435 RepID=F8QHI1_SERL3|nr:hypothetical protein SERLA73DRAFT_66109 [Serpula lacrymans var. lacrymans S7.3]
MCWQSLECTWTKPLTFLIIQQLYLGSCFADFITRPALHSIQRNFLTKQRLVNDNVRQLKKFNMNTYKIHAMGDYV